MMLAWVWWIAVVLVLCSSLPALHPAGKLDRKSVVEGGTRLIRQGLPVREGKEVGSGVKLPVARSDGVRAFNACCV